MKAATLCRRDSSSGGVLKSIMINPSRGQWSVVIGPLSVVRCQL